MNFIESLIKNKFSLLVVDTEDKTPMDYLLTDTATEESILPVIEIAVKYGFNLLHNARDSEDDEGEFNLSGTFLMELFKAEKMITKVFMIVEPLLRQQSLSVIKKFKADLLDSNCKISRGVLTALDAIVTEKLKE